MSSMEKENEKTVAEKTNVKEEEEKVTKAPDDPRPPPPTSAPNREPSPEKKWEKDLFRL